MNQGKRTSAVRLLGIIAEGKDRVTSNAGARLHEGVAECRGKKEKYGKETWASKRG